MESPTAGNGLLDTCLPSARAASTGDRLACWRLLRRRQVDSRRGVQALRAPQSEEPTGSDAVGRVAGARPLPEQTRSGIALTTEIQRPIGPFVVGVAQLRRPHSSCRPLDRPANDSHAAQRQR